MTDPGAIELQGLGVRFGGRPILQALTARLSGRAGAGLDPCGAVQVAFDLDIGQEHEVDDAHLAVAQGDAGLAPDVAREAVLLER